MSSASTQVPRKMAAATTPTTKAIIPASSMARTICSSVTRNAEPTSEVTDWRLRIELPRSPCSTWPIHFT